MPNKPSIKTIPNLPTSDLKKNLNSPSDPEIRLLCKKKETVMDYNRV